MHVMQAESLARLRYRESHMKARRVLYLRAARTQRNAARAARAAHVAGERLAAAGR